MNKEKLLYERALITCVVMLFVCIVLKIFGVEWFNLDTSIPLLNKIDEIVMNSVPLSFAYSFISVFINTALVLLTTIKRYDKKFIVPSVLFVIISMCVKMFISIDYISLFTDTFGMLTLCIYLDKNLCIVKEYLLVFIINMIYQIASLFIRNLNYQIAFRGMIIGILMNVDYYLMLIITYLYLKKGDKTLCGIFLHFGSSLRTKLWKKHSQSSNPCSDKG